MTATLSWEATHKPQPPAGRGWSLRDDQPNLAGPVEQLRQGQALVWAGDRGTDAFLVMSGALRYCLVLVDGRRMISGFAIAGEVFSLSDGERYMRTVEAASDSRVRRIPQAALVSLLSSDSAANGAISSHLVDEPWTLQAELMRHLHRSAETSVAYFVLNMAQRQNAPLADGSKVRFDMSRLDIADYLGLSVETVCRLLKKLVRDGILSSKGPHDMVVSDLHALRQRAGTEGDALS